ncbi:unnamed protein product [Blepharisma stoltei]|uniref:Uncharacterized protein n=1 Tax=Blepharisma stoltei TaxID=1481888 RepID=A0AAU9JJ61_9CILI|nr:unnamed protein product [Blepharisma stoltei]
MDGSLEILMNSLISEYKQVLLRGFFFNFINESYEEVLFKEQPRIHQTQQIQNSNPQSADPKLDSRLEQALEMSRKVVSGGRGKKTPAPVVKKAPPVKKQEIPQTPIILPHFQSNFRLNIQEDLMGLYQETKSRTIGVVFGSKGGIVQAKKAELAAKKSFLTNLKSKFPGALQQSSLEQSIAETAASYQLLSEIRRILLDKQLIELFKSFILLPIGRFKMPEDPIQLFKAFYIFSWIPSQLSKINRNQLNYTSHLSKTFQQESARSLSNDQISRLESFKSEKGILNKLMKACTTDEMNEIISQYRSLNFVLLDKETNKFLFDYKDTVKNVHELKVMHSLVAKNGRATCTLAPSD